MTRQQDDDYNIIYKIYIYKIYKIYISKIYLQDIYVKDWNEARYQNMKNWSWRGWISKGFYSIFKWYAGFLEKYWRVQLERKCKVLIVFYVMLADMISNKKNNQIKSKLFISGTKLNIILF